MRDSICLGLVSGSIGHLARGVLNLFGTHRKGNFADFMAGAIFGIPLVHFMRRTGKDHDLTKGASFGMLIWALFYGTRRSRNLYTLKPKKSRSELLAFLGHLAFGVVTARAAVKLADPGTFPDDEPDFGF